MGTRISKDLTGLQLRRLLEIEARETGSTVKDVVNRALEAWLSDRPEGDALARLAESSFREWEDPRDSDYDRL